MGTDSWNQNSIVKASSSLTAVLWSSLICRAFSGTSAHTPPEKPNVSNVSATIPPEQDQARISFRTIQRCERSTFTRTNRAALPLRTMSTHWMLRPVAAVATMSLARATEAKLTPSFDRRTSTLLGAATPPSPVPTLTATEDMHSSDPRSIVTSALRNENPTL